MNHRKIILVGCISAFVAITTALLGVTGTIIGSVLSSVLFNVLSEMLEKPVEEAKLNSRNTFRRKEIHQNKKFSSAFEYEIAYIFPLVVIVVIQLLLILSFLSEWGFLPDIFLNTYLLIQDLVDNNLYRIMGISLLVISIYPFILKPDIIQKSHGLMVGLVGLIFVARGFVDMDNSITNLYSIFFHYFDFEIELIAFILIVVVILRILISARESQKQFNSQPLKRKRRGGGGVDDSVDFKVRYVGNVSNLKFQDDDYVVNFNSKVRKSSGVCKNHNNNSNINESSDDIQFESNDLLRDKYEQKK